MRGVPKTPARYAPIGPTPPLVERRSGTVIGGGRIAPNADYAAGPGKLGVVSRGRSMRASHAAAFGARGTKRSILTHAAVRAR